MYKSRKKRVLDMVGVHVGCCMVVDASIRYSHALDLPMCVYSPVEGTSTFLLTVLK